MIEPDHGHLQGVRFPVLPDRVPKLVQVPASIGWKRLDRLRQVKQRGRFVWVPLLCCRVRMVPSFKFPDWIYPSMLGIRICPNRSSNIFFITRVMLGMRWSWRCKLRNIANSTIGGGRSSWLSAMLAWIWSGMLSNSWGALWSSTTTSRRSCG